MPKLLLVLLIFLSLKSLSQAPSGNPTYLGSKWYESPYSGVDSSSKFAERDTNWTPRSAGWSVFWKNPGVDSSLWIYNGVKWTRYTNTGGNSSGNGIRYFKTLASFQSATASLDEVSVLDDSVYGGGIFTAHDTLEHLHPDTAFIFHTASNTRVWVRKVYNPNIIMMDWMNIKSGFAGDIVPFIRKAITYLKPKGGGTIYLGAGSFLAATSITFDADNIRLVGAGQNTTFIYPASSSGGGIQFNSNYRDGDWLKSASQMITYDDTNLSVGRGYIDLKRSGDAASLPVGTKIFINAGASHFDQNYGEFDIVDSVIGTRVYLKYNLSRDYSRNRSSWGATLTADFTPPSEGNNATVNFSGDQPPAGTVISIGNDLYSVVSSTVSTAVVINVASKGNSSSLITTGTHIYKYRAIVITPTTVYNSSVESLTITGRRKAITVSNTIKTYFNHVTFNWLPDDPFTGALWLDGDDGRDFNMENCEIHSITYEKCQFARSFTGIDIHNSKLFNSAFEFSEFNSDVNIHSNEIYQRYSGLTNETNITGITIGGTTTNVNFSDNNIWASNLNNLFYSSEIQVFNATGNSAVSIVNNHIFADNIGSIFAGGYFGSVYTIGNVISGSVSRLGNISASLFQSSSYQYSSGGQFGFGSQSTMRDNSFVGKIDGLIQPSANLEFTHNYINRQSDDGGTSEYDAWGNVFYTHYTIDSSAEHFIFKDNTIKGWKLQTNSMSLYGFSLGKRTEICNNLFLDINGSFGTDSIVSLICAWDENTTIPSPRIPVGTGTSKFTSYQNLNYNGTQLGINTNSPAYNLDLTGTSHFYNGQMTLQDAAFFSFSNNSASSLTIPAIINPGYNRKGLIDVNNQLIRFTNGNTDGNGLFLNRPGVGNFAQSIIGSGATQDNSGNYRPGYLDIQLGATGGSMYTHSRFDSLGYHLFTGTDYLPTTLTTTGTTGNQTINTASGTVNIAAAGTSITVTNSIVGVNSQVQAWVKTADANKTKVYAVVPSSGSFIIYVDPAPAAEIKVGFIVTN